MKNETQKYWIAMESEMGVSTIIGLFSTQDKAKSAIADYLMLNNVNGEYVTLAEVEVQ